MKTEKTTTTNGSVNANAVNSKKWFQESTELFMETQNKQMQFAQTLFNTMLNTSFANFGKEKFTTSFGTSEKMTELFQKNIDTISKMMETTMKATTELSSQTNTFSFSKEMMDQATEMFNKQSQMITSLNQSSFEAMQKQAELTKSFVMPFAENLKNEFEGSIQKFNDVLKETTSSFGNFSNPSFTSGQTMFTDLSKQMQTVFSNNMKSWSTMANTTYKEGASFETEETMPSKIQYSKSKMQPSHV